MSDTLNPIISFVSTTASRLPDLAIKNGQLVFIRDKQKIALDLDGKRVFYNQITVLQTEQERQSLLAPISELFYFVVETAILWTYQTTWIQITSKPEIYIGDDLPELGVSTNLYVDRTENNISIWNESDYVVVADSTTSITEEEISNLFG